MLGEDGWRWREREGERKGRYEEIKIREREGEIERGGIYPNPGHGIIRSVIRTLSVS